MNTEHRCQFCDHVFVGRRRKFCFDCLPAYSDRHAKAYQARYNDLYIACGFHRNQMTLASQLPVGHPARPLKQDPPDVEHNCLECGSLCEGRKKFCSPRCYRAHARHATRQKTPTAPTVANQVRTTVVLVEGRRQKNPHKKNRKLGALVAELPIIGSCHYCSGPLRPWWSLYIAQKAQRRCYDCNLKVRKARQPNHIHGSDQYVAAVVACANCSTAFRRDKYRKRYCSTVCRVAGQRDIDRQQRNKRRGAATGIPYTLRMIIDRDGDRCHLCRKPVDMSLPGTHKLGPTIDHLIPISANGLDCFTNVALAHWHCNIKRGATGPAQLRLVG